MVINKNYASKHIGSSGKSTINKSITGTHMKPAKLKILQDLKVLSETEVRKNLDDIKNKIEAGFYDQPKVLNKIVDGILKDIAR